MAIKWLGRTPGSLASREGRWRRERQPQPRPHTGHAGTSVRLLEGLMGIWSSRKVHSSSGSWSCRLTVVTSQLLHPGPAQVWPTAVTRPMPATARGRGGVDGVDCPPRGQKNSWCFSPPGKPHPLLPRPVRPPHLTSRRSWSFDLE